MNLQPCLRCGEKQVEIAEWYYKNNPKPYCGDNPKPYYQGKCKNGHAWDEVLDTIEEAEACWNEKPLVAGYDLPHCKEKITIDAVS